MGPQLRPLRGLEEPEPRVARPTSSFSRSSLSNS